MMERTIKLQQRLTIELLDEDDKDRVMGSVECAERHLISKALWDGLPFFEQSPILLHHIHEFVEAIDQDVQEEIAQKLANGFNAESANYERQEKKATEEVHLHRMKTLNRILAIWKDWDTNPSSNSEAAMVNIGVTLQTCDLASTRELK